MLVADERHRCIKVIGRYGTIRRWLGVGQLFRPSAVAMRGQEVIVIDKDNGCVQVFRLDGTLVRVWDTYLPSYSHITVPVAVAVTRKGQVLLCDSANNCVHIFE